MSENELDAVTPSLYHRIRGFVRRPEIAWSLTLFLLTRLFLSLLGYELWSMGMVPEGPDPSVYFGYAVSPVGGGAAGVLLGVWRRWDAIHYLRIAAEGYSSVELFTFLPLYPLLVRLVGTVLGGHMLLGSMIVSSVACLLLLIVLHKLVTDEGLGLDVARRSLIYLVIFPTAFFLFVPYTESLFMLLCVVTLREARRERWLPASLAAFAAVLTRLVGVTLLFVLVIEMLRSVNWDPRRLGARLALASFPVIGFGGFLAWRAWAGVPGMSEALAALWNRVPAFPWQGIVLTLQRISTGDVWLAECFDFAVVLLMFGLGIIVVKRLPLSYGAFFWSGLLFNLSQVRLDQPLGGQGRYSLPLFPAFIVLARLGRSPRWNRIIFVVSVSLWVFWASVFIMWRWVG